VKSLVNYAAHILSLKHQEELRIGALRDMAASQSHEMRNSLSALIGLGEINETGVETVRGRKLFNEKVGDMISDVNDIIAINNAIEAAHQRTPEMGLAQNVKIAEQLQEIWEQILGSEGFLNFRYNIHNLYNYDINYIEKDGELNKTGSLPKASIKMILKELLKNAIKYSDYCYIKKNEQASGISMKLLLQESSFTIVIGNGVSRDYFINKDNFALDRYEELKSVSYGFIKSPSAFSTKIGLNNIEDYILANYKGDINSLITITKPTEKSLYYSIQLKLPYEVNKI